MFGAERPEDEIYPPGLALCLSKIIDLVTLGSDWRRHVPFGLTDPPSGWFSYKLGNVAEETFPDLLTYGSYLEQQEQQQATTSSLGSLYDFAFRTNSTVLGELVNPTAAVVLLVLVLLFRTIKAYLIPRFSALGRRAGRATHGVEWEKKNEERIVKFGEYVFRLLYHFAVSIYGVWYFWDKPWWDPSKGGTATLFVGHPHQPIEVGMAWYYLVQSAYNIEALLNLMELSFDVKFQSPVQYLLSQSRGGGGKDGSKTVVSEQRTLQVQSPISVRWSDTVRGDFREMMIHHVVTNLLILGSSGWRFTRIGSMVFLVHDVSDVPVDLSKLANFLKWKKVTVGCFVTMVLVWLATRLLVLPFVIYRSVLTESYLLVSDGKLDPVYYYAYRPFFYTLVALIILLHVAWFLMFVRMGWLLVSKGEAHDLSEHKKGEKQLEAQRNGGARRRTDAAAGAAGAPQTNGASAEAHKTKTS